jgi:hypothetical protein
MNAEADMAREDIKTLREYIQLLEIIRRMWVGFRLSANAKVVLNIIDRKIGWPIQLMAGAAGLGVFLVGLSFGRLIARSPVMLVLIFIAAGLLAIFTVIAIFYQVRRRIADQEIKMAQIEIYRLEGLLNK